MMHHTPHYPTHAVCALEVPSPLATSTLYWAADSRVCAHRWEQAQGASSAHSPKGMDTQAAIDWLAAYWRGEVIACPPQWLDMAIGTPFERAVWMTLCDIPYGSTCTYTDVAHRLGKTATAARAVGRAIGRNPIAVFVPCHRVIGSSGALTGFAWGLERKRALLALEGVGQNQLSLFDTPT